MQQRVSKCRFKSDSKKTPGTIVILSNLFDRKSGLNLTMNYLELGNQTIKDDQSWSKTWPKMNAK